MPSRYDPFAHFSAAGANVVCSCHTADGLLRLLRPQVEEDQWDDVCGFIDHALVGSVCDVRLANGSQVQIARCRP